MVWGGHRLLDVLGKTPSAGDTHQANGRFGESWEVSDHPLHDSRLNWGPLAPSGLRTVMETAGVKLLGAAAPKFRRFPWLIKWLDADDWLSVQVHPDETAVQRLLPGEGSKTEVWFVLEAAPGSRIYAGLLPGVDRAALLRALDQGRVADCLHHFEPRPGDGVFLPAGTVHAVGGGVLMAEVQQTSDATFRLFDWNRRDAQGKSRPLHIEESLASIDWQRGPVTPVRAHDFPGPVRNLESVPARRQALCRSAYFELTYVSGSEPIACGGNGRLQALLILAGAGTLATSWQEERVTLGDVWVFPASTEPTWCRPDGALAALLCTLPE
jgi:mannose-6-phosphate isomerase